jgi:hypothetical protein
MAHMAKLICILLDKDLVYVVRIPEICDTAKGGVWVLTGHRIEIGTKDADFLEQLKNYVSLSTNCESDKVTDK